MWLWEIIRFCKCLNMNSMKLVIPLHSLYWSIHTKDESKHGIAFAFIFDVNWLWRCGVTALFGLFFHGIHVIQNLDLLFYLLTGGAGVNTGGAGVKTGGAGVPLQATLSKSEMIEVSVLKFSERTTYLCSPVMATRVFVSIELVIPEKK